MVRLNGGVGMKNKYTIGEEDEMELYRNFFKKMLELGYAPFYIGEKLALIVRAVSETKTV